MAAGVKPTAIMRQEDISSEMQTAIELGHVVKIDEVSFETTHRLYCHPSEIDNATKAMEILSRVASGSSDANPTKEECDFLSQIFEETLPGEGFILSEISEASYAAENNLFDGHRTQNIENLLDGTIKIIPPMRYDEEYYSDDNLEQAVANGSLVSVNFKISTIIAVYAQSNKIEEGQELFARYFKDEHDYDDLGDDFARRIGELLGFTDNDIAWHYGDKYQNPIILKLMGMTADFRSWCRMRHMLMDAEDKAVSLSSAEIS